MCRSHVSRAAAVALLTSIAAFAANIQGVVRDPSGSAMSGVTVSIDTIPPSTPRTVKSDGSGAFRVAGLAAGRYVVRVSQPGFETSDSEVLVEEGKDAPVEVHLKLAGIREHIEVAGG